MKVELVYFEGCPHVAETRVNLMRALGTAGLDPVWTEWDLEDEATPEAYERLPSPTVLIEGQDVSPVPAHAGKACRASGAPSVETLERALRSARGSLP